ncbi:hypothetical protein [Leptospira idonii]|uniref:Lipoprotein n=1 Tax=Leptospira idonii TaxID=1193500 RepID=A0A4R9LYG2_9LEPT|nr:hypothetical protein [Leptospira idonii]TGN19363.1 hypothetical protein EHS15_08440 [Leptospira idonii]
MKFSFLVLFTLLLLIGCKQNLAVDEFDELKRTGSVFSLARYCEENKLILARREKECEKAFADSLSEIESILSRQIDLSLTKVIVPKSKGEEIELLLRTKTKWGIRYLEIWKQSVILE